jgi:heat-inducible transcriptional repressor
MQPKEDTPLNERERTVLKCVIQDFIETASPVGSRFISKRHVGELGLSSASIRNVLADLEQLGYINHPHTSAGRVPTDLGYRFYLDWLMRKSVLTAAEQEAIRVRLHSAEEMEQMLKDSSRLLARISQQLSIVTAPELSSGVFEHLELVPISSTRLLVILSITSGLVRTIMMEVAAEPPRGTLDEIARALNERLGGLTLQQIRDSLPERLRDAQVEDPGLLRLFIDSVDKLFTSPREDRVHISGAEGLLQQPEFVSPKEFRGVIELISDEEFIVHVLRKHDPHGANITVTVGSEHDDQKLEPYSVITATYSIGDVSGSIGVLGPKRMPYDRMIPLVDYIARTVSHMFSQTQRSRNA